MYALAVAVMIAQPAPKVPEFKLDPVTAEAIKPDPKDPPLRKLQKERCRERADALDRITEIVTLGNWSPSFYRDYVKLQITFWENLAELEEKPADRVKYFERRVDAAKEIERFLSVLVNAGNEPPHSHTLAKATRIDTEIDLLKLKDQMEKAGKK